MTSEAGPGACDRQQAAFLLCELDWARRSLISRLAYEPLASFAEHARTGVAQLDAASVDAIRACVEDLEELVMSVASTIATLAPADVRADARLMSAAAGRALADGIADTERAMHAASWIDAEQGPAALVVALRETDAHRFWKVGVVRFLEAFRGIDHERAFVLAARADLQDGIFAELADEQAARLAQVLAHPFDELP